MILDVTPHFVSEPHSLAVSSAHIMLGVAPAAMRAAPARAGRLAANDSSSSGCRASLGLMLEDISTTFVLGMFTPVSRVTMKFHA